MRTNPIPRLLPAFALLAATAPPSATPIAAPIATGPFEAIQLRAGDTVEIVRSPTGVVVTDADPRTLAQLSVETVGGVLRIGRKPDLCHVPGECEGTARLRVSTPQLTRINLQGSGSVQASDAGARRIDIVMQGSGDVRLRGIAADEVVAQIDGTGIVELNGRTERLDVQADGPGTLAATGLAARDADIRMNGNGAIRARASGAVAISANGPGTIRIDGTRNCAIARRGLADIACGTGA